MDKKTIIIILLVIVIVMAACLITYTLTISSQNSSTYERVNLSSTCSLELPKVHFDVQNTSFGGSYAGVTTHTDGKTLISTNLVITYVKTVDNTGLSSDAVYNSNSQMNVGNENWYSRDVTNMETGETISISGTDKEVVNHIADSIQFSKGNATNSTKDLSQSSSNSKNTTNDPIVGYLGDGTPVHQSEYSKYYDKQPIYTFDPSDSSQMSAMQDKMNEAEDTMQDSAQSSEGGSSSGGSIRNGPHEEIVTTIG